MDSETSNLTLSERSRPVFSSFFQLTEEPEGTTHVNLTSAPVLYLSVGPVITSESAKDISMLRYSRRFERIRKNMREQLIC